MTEGYGTDLLAATEAVDRRHFWYRARSEVIAAAAARALGDGSAGPIVEVGCGNGAVLGALVRRFPGAAVVGLERFVEGASAAARRTGAPTAVADVACLPVRSAVRLVGAFDVVEHLDDDLGALRSLHGVLRPGGSLLLTVPADPKLWSAFDEASGHRRRYTQSSLAAVVEGAGFELRYLTPFMALLHLPARLRRRSSPDYAPGAEPDAAALVAAELQVGGVVNAVLYRVLRQEARVVARGRRLPSGTSLLCEAVRP